ncbi:hypothetical protein HYR99_41580 [Candidatus Poribacteria bacterium]|nr:hypothetical protein [Candidatus Poribacteria bacterium]
MIKHKIVALVPTLCVGMLAFVILSLLGCGEDGLISPHGEVDTPPPSSEGLRAVDFPTNSGSAWTYVSVETGQEFTLRIEGTRDIEGFTNRQMTVSEIRPTPPDSLNRAAIDHLSANGLYFRIDSDFINFALPLFATYFVKTPQAYNESAFDAYISFLDNPVLHQNHFPLRRIWDFPLKVGKEWIVFEKTTLPASRVIRRVIASNVPVTVPAGSYDAYGVEEEIVGIEGVEPSRDAPDQLPFIPPARYWVVPNVGVVKYQYIQFVSVEQPTLRTFELKNATLTDANSR